MSDRTTFAIRLISPEGVQFDGESQIAILNGVGGDVGLLANHAPIVADLKMGTCRLQDSDGAWHTWATAEGFATSNNSRATVLVEEAINVDDIDIAAADELITEHTNRIADADKHGGEHDVYSSGVEGSKRSVAWGEHLKAVHAAHASN